MTKIDLLCAQEVGYVLQSASAFAPLVFPTNLPPAAHLKRSIRFYLFPPTVAFRSMIGTSPLACCRQALLLDPFSGTLAGTTTTDGLFNFTVRVRGTTTSPARP